MKKVLSFILLSFFLFSCAESSSKNQVQIKTLPDYKQLWKDTFLNYQNSKSQLKDFWVFDFESTLMIDGDEKTLIQSFSNLNLEEPFNSFSVKVDWDYDFRDKKNIILNGNFKIYFNKRNFWLWDLDIRFSLKENKYFSYSLNNLDGKLLKLLLKDKAQIDNLILFFNDNKWWDNTYEISPEILESLFHNTWEKSLEETLYKNSQKEEAAIINSFLNKEVIEILSWETKNDIDSIYFKLNTDHLVDFLNEVSVIIWDEKDFSQDKKLFQNILLSWNFEIKNTLIINSYIKTQIILAWQDELWNKKEDILTFESILKIPDIKNFNLDFTTLISSVSTYNNKLQLRLKWLIK